MKKYRFLALFLSVVLLVYLFPTVNVANAEELIDAEISATETVEKLTADTKILEYVDEAVFAANKHVKRLPEEETLSSYVFLNNDGTKTVYYTYQEVKYQSTDGTVVEKDISLINTTNGYTTASNDVSLTLPNNPANGIEISYSGYDVVLTPLGGKLRRAAQSSENAVSYPDYFGEGASLMYTPTLDGVKEDIVLTHYTGINTFSFYLETNGLTPYLENNHYYLAKSADADMRIEMGDIVSFDAHGKFSIGSLSVQTVTAGEEYVLTLTVDKNFLTNENTIYPVSIDPTLTIQGTNAIEDVTIYSGRPNVNGNWTYSHCGYYDNTYQVARTLVRLPGLYNDNNYRSFSPGAITHAYFYIREATGTAGQSVTLRINTGNHNWTESGATWTNAGHAVGNIMDTQSPEYEEIVRFDITSLLKRWKVSPINYTYAGFILQNTNETSASKEKTFYSSEYSTSSLRPYVVVTYSNNSDPMPTSGAEKDFDLAEWTGTLDCLELMCNCYSYALNNQKHPDYMNNVWVFQQPGAYYSENYSHTTEADVFSAVTRDYNKFRENFNKPDYFTIARIGQYATCPTGMYKIALVQSEGGGLHWYRQNSNGKWSHKNGSRPATNLDESSHEITDPWTANRGTYVRFLGYYAVSPWDLLWTEDKVPSFYITPDFKDRTFDQALDWLSNTRSALMNCCK